MVLLSTALEQRVRSTERPVRFDAATGRPGVASLPRAGQLGYPYV